MTCCGGICTNISLCGVIFVMVSVVYVFFVFFFLMIRRPPRSTQSRSSAASDVYKRQIEDRDMIAADGGRYMNLISITGRTI